MSGIVHSMLWKLLERGGVQVSQFIVSIVIARLLLPSAYGAVAILMIFISLATVFVQSGLNTALIQKKDANDSDISAVLIYSLCIASIIYIILFITAPYIAIFFNIAELSELLRILSLILFPGAVNSIQLAILSKRMQFKQQFIAGIISSILSGGIGILMAYWGFEAWALVAQQLSYQVLCCGVFAFMVRWSFTFRISIQRTRAMLSYGVRLLGARLVDTLYHNLESFVIGKAFAPSILAYCNKGKQFPLTLIDNIDGSVQSVMLPAYSSRQEDLSQVKSLLRRTISLSTYIVFPTMLLLAATGRPLIHLILGDNWMECVPYLQLFCIISMLFPLQTANLQAINAIGRSDVYLKLITWKRVVGVVLLVSSIFIWFSPFAVVIAALLSEIIAVLINIPANKCILSYTFSEMLTDILPNICLAVAVCLCGFCMELIIANDILLLLTQLVIGVVIFIGLSVVMKNKNLVYLIERFHLQSKLKIFAQ